ncbi:uracil-DNA glycosylase [Infundibulicybe gibba]|nr:uracil-DNA glycosylase [Infundibulicybe gibba]
MAAKQPTVYLEDIVSPPSAPITTTKTAPVAQASAGSSSATQSGTSGVKRQRTLMDMVPTTKKEPSTKKLKLTASGSAPAASSGSATFGFGLQKLNSIPFSLSSFQDSLTEEQKDLLRLECEVMGKSWWAKLLKNELKKPYFIDLKRFLWKEGVKGANDTPSSLRIYPAAKNIYAWSNTPLGKSGSPFYRTTLLHLFVDPYHGAGQAHGLCFSVPQGVGVPPSLKNIYAELKAEYPDFEPPKHGNLTTWALNGVLMLNTCLTVRAGSAGSHFSKGWEQFTDKVLDIVDKYGGANLPNPSDLSGSEGCGVGRGVVFLAWGTPAAQRVAKLEKHPSPLSAHRGFLGNGHFKAANKWLEQKYGAEGMVDWCKLDLESE